MIMKLICLLFGHKKSEVAGGQDGYWYLRCPRCKEWMGTAPGAYGEPVKQWPDDGSHAKEDLGYFEACQRGLGREWLEDRS